MKNLEKGTKVVLIENCEYFCKGEIAYVEEVLANGLVKITNHSDSWPDDDNIPMSVEVVPESKIKIAE